MGRSRAAATLENLVGLLQLAVDEENVGEVDLLASATSGGDFQVTRAEAEEPVLEEVIALLVENETHGIEVLFTFTNFFNDGELGRAKNNVVSLVVHKDDEGPNHEQDHSSPEIELHVEEEVNLDDSAKNWTPPTHQAEDKADDDEGSCNQSSPDTADVHGGEENDNHQDDDESETQAGGGGHLDLDNFAFVGESGCCASAFFEEVHGDFFTGHCGNAGKYEADQPERPVVEDLAVADQFKFQFIRTTNGGVGWDQVARCLWSRWQQGVEILAHCDSLLEHCVSVGGKGSNVGNVSHALGSVLCLLRNGTDLTGVG